MAKSSFFEIDILEIAWSHFDQSEWLQKGKVRSWPDIGPKENHWGGEEEQQHCSNCQIDFKNNFDSKHRAVMMKIPWCRDWGVWYPCRRTPGRHPGPLLFIVSLDYVLQKTISGWEQELGFTTTPQRSTRNPAVALTDMDYADEICLISTRWGRPRNSWKEWRRNMPCLGSCRTERRVRSSHIISSRITHLSGQPKAMQLSRWATSSTWVPGSTQQSRI